MSDIKVGDLVTAYWKGYFRLVGIRKVYKPIIAENRHQFFVHEGDPNAGEYYASLFDDSRGNPRKSNVTHTCDSKFCKLATDEIAVDLKELQDTQDKLSNIYNKELNNVTL